MPEHDLHADILVTKWDCGTSAAFDITVTSPLNSPNMLEAGMFQGVSAKSAEHRKHTENDPKFVELGWRCIPLAVESYGAWGPEASKAFSQVATRLAIRGNTPKAKIVAELYMAALVYYWLELTLDQSFAVPIPNKKMNWLLSCFMYLMDLSSFMYLCM